MIRTTCIAALLALSAPAAWAASTCTDTVNGTSHTLSCQYQSKSIAPAYGVPRSVPYQLPDGTPPVGGWPAVVMYQPSIFPTFWTAPDSTPAGAYYQVQTIQALLDAGYAVIAPPANQVRVFQYWDTNTPGVDTSYSYTTLEDYSFLSNLLNAIVGGQFGRIDGTRLFATGMSSGGYNTSRMAVSFQGRFRALAVQSGSYANCLGAQCTIPPQLPYNHPPTLFLHGGSDTTVPPSTMQAYYDRLQAQGIPVREVIAPNLTHEYLPAAPTEIVAWFNRYR
jgi:predicted esterase